MSIANPHLHENGVENAKARSLKRWATVASLSVATMLVTVKVFASLVTDSVSMLTSLMDSGVDAIASAATMAGVIHAASPADDDHRYGHGKAEALTALAQALFISGSGAFILFQSVRRLFDPVMIGETTAGIAVTIFSVALTAALLLFQRYVVARTGSVAIGADALHYRGDIFLNAGVLAALVLSRYSGWPYFDPLFALCAAVVLLKGARGIGGESLDILMDRELPEADRARIMALAEAHPSVQAVHDLRTRSGGTRVFIEFHMELDGAMPLEKAHDVTEEVERALFDAFPRAEVIIHQEPAGIDDHRIDRVIAEGGTA